MVAGFTGICKKSFYIEALEEIAFVVIPEVVNRESIFFKNKRSWIPAFAGMTAKTLNICKEALAAPR